jgi:transposase
MAKREFQLSEEQQGDLRQAYESTNNVEERRRLQAVRLYGEGWGVSDIQSITGCGYRSLLRWCRDYMACGVAGLKDGWVGGNWAKLTKEQRAEMASSRNTPQTSPLQGKWTSS